MTCAEFQKVLPYIIETGGNAEEEKHLAECPVCSDLVQDLRYIAEQAKLLVPMEDPSPKVWDGIRDGLQREGLVKPARARGRLLGPQSAFPWIAALAALVLVITGLSLYQRGRDTQTAERAAAPAPAVTTVSFSSAIDPQQDQQVLAHVQQTRPMLASTYEQQLRQVNASISDARRSVQQNPDDSDARQSLAQAYEQKAMLYDMATR
jgi:hypothetical protein